MSVDLAAYGPTSNLSERALLRGYGASALEPAVVKLVDAQPCACGGLIDPRRDSAIFDAVAAHNGTQRHLRWRERRDAR